MSEDSLGSNEPVHSMAELEVMAKEVLYGTSRDRQLECVKPLARFVDDFCTIWKESHKPQPPLPIDTEEVEGLARAFLLGAFVCVTGGFPSVAFHDGYREYDERIEGWLAGRSSSEQKRQWETEYAAGAFARLLEEEGVEI